MICEIIGGLIANSLAIMTDAAHLLSDLAGFLISIFALWLATRPATSRLSFGFHRAEILGALISVLLIWVLTGVLVYEAIWRLAHPEDVDGKIMFIVSAAGLACNFCMGMILVSTTHNLPPPQHNCMIDARHICMPYTHPSYWLDCAVCIIFLCLRCKVVTVTPMDSAVISAMITDTHTDPKSRSPITDTRTAVAATMDTRMGTATVKEVIIVSTNSSASQTQRVNTGFCVSD